MSLIAPSLPSTPKKFSAPQSEKSWTPIRFLIWPLSAALLFRVGLMLAAYFRTGTQVMTQGDSWSYLIPGRNLLLHGSFANNGLPEIDRTPGYPIFAELSGMIVGNVLLTIGVQILLSLISIWLAASITERLFIDCRAAAITAWLLACDPLSITSSVRIMPETLFVFLLLLCLERMISFAADKKLTQLAQAGALLALATFVRPVSYYLVLPFAVVAVACSPQCKGMKWKAPFILLIAFIPFIAAWQLRNYVETGYNGFSSIVEKNLYFYQSAEIRAELDHLSLVEEQKKLGYSDNASYLVAHPEQRAWNRIKQLQFMKSEAVKVLRQHPLMYLRSHFIGVAIVAFSPGSTELLQLINAYPSAGKMPKRLVSDGIKEPLKQLVLRHFTLVTVMCLFSGFTLALYLAACTGLFTARLAPETVWILAGTAIYFLLISGGAQAVARYRLPAIPELCILASGGICILYDKTKRSRRSSSVQVVVSAG
ncbi:glycosyltransferase family 39 protein [Acidicapsa dinghuensis]|uniref:Glycosyltransferase family 39 protein n=1 Tax=Acidicapsa dinghuensis TaxID=2218256 RepID=A0ABW1EKH5_9BACT|nr:glycosyltransferase family 39 protein [Acidicapsa dinghuensis]